MKRTFRQVPIEKLRWRCDFSDCQFESTQELESFPTILGQDRAVRALKAGLEMNFPGFNIYVSGESGTGRTTTTKFLLKKIKSNRQPLQDICYVNNFKNPDMPIALYFSAGRGKIFKSQMDSMIEHLKNSMQQIFESEKYTTQRDEILEQINVQQRKLFEDFEKYVNQDRFTIVQVQVGPYTKPDVLPVIGEQPVPIEQLPDLMKNGSIKKEEAEQLIVRHDQLSKELSAVFKKSQNLQRQKRSAVAKLDRGIVRPMVSIAIHTIRKKFRDKRVGSYLDAVKHSILTHLDLFRKKNHANDSQEKKQPSGIIARDHYLWYRVNVLVANSEGQSAPIIFENSPTFSKLFGTIERIMDSSNGQWLTDFTKIRAGSLLHANGGFLVLYARDALIESGVWNTLKRVLKNRKTEIQNFDPYFFTSFTALKPEPIDVDIKVIMIGDAMLYSLLYQEDPDFKKIFKIKADFDSEMRNDQDNLLKYARFVKQLCESEKLLPFDKSAIAAVVEYGIRLAGRQSRITTQFNYIADLVREAHFYAKEKRAKLVQQKYVELALKEQNNRLSLTEEKIREMIREGTLLIDTEGAKVGQVNGLSVLGMVDYSFGQPSRITAQVAIGRDGIINIEREAELSGPIHNKGVLIIAGFLQGKFAQNKPLAMNASLCFEQSYSGVEGDSASSTEIYALLSRLANVPIRQDLAVTGSVNQNGEIQAIGGVNEKIEGFYKICQVKGLTGTQGVIIPEANVENLQLSNELVEQIKKKKFHIYPVSTIEEGIEILTGIPAGQCDAQGIYPANSIYGLADAKLTEFARVLQSFSRDRI